MVIVLIEIATNNLAVATYRISLVSIRQDRAATVPSQVDFSTLIRGYYFT